MTLKRRSAIPSYQFRGQETRLPSLGEAVGVAFPSKSACYSGGEISHARRSVSDEQDTSESAESLPDSAKTADR